VVVGLLAGGGSGEVPWLIHLNASANIDAVQAVLRNATYEDISPTPSTAARTVEITVKDGTGGASSPARLEVGVAGIPESPVLTWPALADIAYGTPLESIQLNAFSDVQGAIVYDPPAGRVLSAGIDQILLAQFTPTDLTNYTVTTATNRITVLRASLVLRADNLRKTVGQTNPPLTFTTEGLVDGDTEAVLNPRPVLSTVAETASPPGVYPIIISGGLADNYEISRVDGTLTIDPAGRFDGIELLSNGSVRLRIAGVPVRTYRLEGAGDLHDWQTVDTVQTDSAGQGEHVVTPGLPHQFYRLAWP